jgi:hypothetical protein
MKLNNYIGWMKMYPINWNFISAICLINFFYMFQIALSQEVKNNDDQLSKGLVGILYDDTNLSRPVSIWHLDKLDSKQPDWENRNDFSAKWQGVIKAPVSGDLTIIGEADNGVLLQIDGKTVLDGWENGRSVRGIFDVNKGDVYSVNLSYRQVNGSSYLRLYWQWKNQPKTIIPPDAIWFTDEDESHITEVYNEALVIPFADLEFDIASIIEIDTEIDIINKRKALIKQIFGKEGIPFKKLPDSIQSTISDQEFKSLTNLMRIDKLDVELEWGLNSIAYHFVPIKSKNMTVLYHQGHRGKFAGGISTIQAFLAKGFDVIALSMPLKGFNRKPIGSFPRFGKIMIETHEQMSLLTPSSGHPIRYFLEPVMIMVNYLKSLNFDQIMMIGISGGGWTTTLCAAIDTRIAKSFPVAGSLPFYLRSRDLHNKSWGDYEQYVPEIYRVANYLDLYIMGAFGENRNQLQILNQYDSCCFDGTGYTTYVDLIKSRINALESGYFDVFLDSSHREHKISKAALEVIFKDLNL